MSKTLMFPNLFLCSFLIVVLGTLRTVPYLVLLHTKNVGAHICLFVFEAYHSLNGKQAE